MNWLLLGLAATALCVFVCCYLIGYVVGGRDEARALAETLRLLNHPHVQEHGPEVLQALSERLERVRPAAPERR